MLEKWMVVSLLALNLSGCGPAKEKSAAPSPVDAQVRALADKYVAASFERFPEQVTLYGVPGHRQDELPDNSLEALEGAGRRRRTAGSRRPSRSIRRPSGHRRCARPTPSSARRWRRRSPPRLPQRAVDGQPDRQRLAGAGRIPRHDSAGRHRRGAQERAGALERAAASTSTPRSPICAKACKPGLYRAEGQRPHRHRPDEHADRDADRRFAVRLAVGAGQDAGVPAAVRRAGARADRAGVQAVPRFSAA